MEESPFLNERINIDIFNQYNYHSAYESNSIGQRDISNIEEDHDSDDYHLDDEDLDDDDDDDDDEDLDDDNEDEDNDENEEDQHVQPSEIVPSYSVSLSDIQNIVVFNNDSVAYISDNNSLLDNNDNNNNDNNDNNSDSLEIVRDILNDAEKFVR